MKNTKAIYFIASTAAKTVDAYNKWAENKVLAKDVIVHSHIIQPNNVTEGALIILVFFDERIHPEWIGKAEAPQTSTTTVEM